MLLEVMPANLLPRDTSLLLMHMHNLPWHTMLPVLADVSLYVAIIRDQHNMQLAKLLLDQAAAQFSKATAGSTAAHGSKAEAAEAAESAGHARRSKQMFSSLLCHEYVASMTPPVLQGLLNLGLRPDKVNSQQQPLLHAALEGRCSSGVALMLLEASPPEVMLHEDASHNYPLHYIARLPDLNEPDRLSLLRAACNRCERSKRRRQLVSVSRKFPAA